MDVSLSSVFRSNYASVPPSAGTAGSAQVGDPDGDGGGKRAHGHRGGHGGGGPMGQALAQALQSLGLTLPTQAASSTSQTTATAGGSTSDPDGDGDSEGATAASGDVRQDMHKFMHALFGALRSESSSSGDGSSGSGGQDPRASFASDLASLITQTSQGNAPQGLQSAFSQLVGDLQGNSGSTTADGSASPGTVSLQDLLTKLQAQMGYGSPATSSAVGNLVSATA